MKNETWITKDTKALFQAFLALQNEEEVKRFLRDLMTEKEILECANRWKAARMLDTSVPYVEIERETGMSSTTIARIARWMKEGKGGYKLMLDRTKEAQ